MTNQINHAYELIDFILLNTALTHCRITKSLRLYTKDFIYQNGINIIY